MGLLIKSQAKTLSSSLFSKTTAPVMHLRIIEQNAEIGEQLKVIGHGLNALGGKGVLVAEKDIERKEEKEQKFVSNIEPDKKEKKKGKKEKKKGKSNSHASPGDVADGFITDDELEKNKP